MGGSLDLVKCGDRYNLKIQFLPSVGSSVSQVSASDIKKRERNEKHRKGRGSQNRKTLPIVGHSAEGRKRLFIYIKNCKEKR